MVERLIPQADFSAIGNLPATVEAGRNVARQYALRSAMTNIAPDDFQGMAKVLQQFGTPEQAITAYAAGRQTKALEEQIAHEKTMENLALYGAAREGAVTTAKLTADKTRALAPFNAVIPDLKDFDTLRNTVVNSPGGDVGGTAKQRLSNLARNVYKAQHPQASANDIQAYVDTVIPSGSLVTSLDPYLSQRRQDRLDILGSDIRQLKGPYESYQGEGTGSVFDVPGYNPASKPTSAPSPSVLRGKSRPVVPSQEPVVPGPNPIPVPTVSIPGENATGAPAGNLPLIPGSNKPVPEKLLPIYHTHGLEYNRATHVIRDVVTKTLYNDNGDLVGGK